jgi:hypothetical protein
MQDETMNDGAAQSRLGCALCAYTGGKHALFDEIMSYVTDNAHRVHLQELVTHVQAALSEHLQICMTRDRIRQHFLTHACDQRVVLNHVLRDMVDILAVAKSNCVVVSEEGMQSMDPKATGVYIDAVKQVMSIYKQLDLTARKS